MDELLDGFVLLIINIIGDVVELFVVEGVMVFFVE